MADSGVVRRLGELSKSKAGIVLLGCQFKREASVKGDSSLSLVSD